MSHSSCILSRHLYTVRKRSHRGKPVTVSSMVVAQGEEQKELVRNSQFLFVVRTLVIHAIRGTRSGVLESSRTVLVCG